MSRDELQKKFISLVDKINQELLLKQFHERVERLTGDSWCPYPSQLMMVLILVAGDDEAKRLIEERRRYSFPAFVRGEPMQEWLLEVLERIEV